MGLPVLRILVNDLHIQGCQRVSFWNGLFFIEIAALFSILYTKEKDSVNLSRLQTNIPIDVITIKFERVSNQQPYWRFIFGKPIFKDIGNTLKKIFLNFNKIPRSATICKYVWIAVYVSEIWSCGARISSNAIQEIWYYWGQKIVKPSAFLFKAAPESFCRSKMLYLRIYISFKPSLKCLWVTILLTFIWLAFLIIFYK